VAQIPLIRVAGKDAPAEIDRLLAQSASTGLYPILFHEGEDWESIRETIEDADGIAAILDRSRSIDPSSRFRGVPGAEVGEWPYSPVEPTGLEAHLDLRELRPKDEVVIRLMKLDASWQAFAHLRWGGWNDCPTAEEHCAVHRDWSSRFGSEVVCIVSDVVQCRVARPPQDRTASLDLAREQCAYCPDLGYQGTGMIARLAASLLGAEYWYFWWD
jgi:hypothetical protein